ncbi:unnamed protein product [Brassica napus]|uniref:non-specific serine/threonine protein kinase n=1 Tax=Brassica napus TaxID=3708 RepID=A0A816NZR6_BRANA|nr:unnamed protein product [Brassica napus]
MASSQRHPEKDAAGIIRQIVNVVQACHFMGVMHRDIKHENFLFSSNDENALLKAIDFRCAVFIDKEPEEHMLYEIQNAPIDFESHPWPCTSSAATDLVKKMLIRNPKKRITAAKVLAKPLFFSFLLSRELSLQSLTFLYPYNYNQHMVRTFQGDVDGNGTIDIEEFISATLDRFKLDQDEQVRLAFQHFDKDNDRLITRDELEIAMKDCGV